MEILFPVIDPVHILGLGFLDRARSQIHEFSHFVQFISDFLKNCFFVLALFQIKT